MTMTLIASAFHPDALWLSTPSDDAPAKLRKAAQKLADERAALVADYEQIAGREPGPRASGPEPDEARATCCREWADWVDRAGPWLRHAADVALAEGEYLDNKAREARAAFQRACREVCDEYGREIPILLAAARRPEIDRLRVAAAQTPGGQWLRERASALERLAKAAPGEASRLRSLADFFARRAAGAAERHAPGPCISTRPRPRRPSKATVPRRRTDLSGGAEWRSFSASPGCCSRTCGRAAAERQRWTTSGWRAKCGASLTRPTAKSGKLSRASTPRWPTLECLSLSRARPAFCGWPSRAHQKITKR